MSEERHCTPLTDLQRAELEQAVSAYGEALRGDVSAVRYLTARGLSRATVERFRLGVVHRPMPGHYGKEGMLAIPYLAGRDRHPVSIRFRCIQDHDCRELRHGKYQGLPGDATRMFNATAMLDMDVHAALDVTEGEMDAMILTQLGYHAVAIPGAHAFKRHHAIMLDGMPSVRVWGDGDKAGHEFIAAVKKSLPRTAVGIDMPDGHDVNKLFLEQGELSIKRLATGEER